MTTQQTANNLLHTTRHFPQTIPTVAKARDFRTPSYIHNSWLSKIQNKTTIPNKSSSLFDEENRLMNGLWDTSKDSHIQKIFLFCNQLKASTQGTLSVQNTPDVASRVNICKEQIGKIIFLTEKDPLLTASLINPEEVILSITNIQSAYDKEIQKILTNIKTRKKSHEKVPLQDPKQVSSAQKPFAIASLLMTSSGILNLGLIDSIKKHFFDFKSDLRMYEKDIIQSLDVIKNSPEIQETLRTISKPANPYFVSNDIIRISLNLPLATPITDLHAKTVALSALLSDIRQGDVGSCFATSVSILMMGTLKAKVISDFSSILNQGMISRPSLIDQTDFIPVIDIGDGTSQKILTIRENGQYESENGFLWQAPGLISASKQLGISETDLEKTTLTIINERLQKQTEHKKTVELTIDDLLTELIKKKQDKLPLQEQTDLKNLALLAFNAETNTPLLRAWESCLAAMAEASNGNTIRQKIKECIATALSKEWPRRFFTGMTTETKKVQDIFNRSIDSAIQLRYDEQVAIKTAESGDGHSTMAGAFVLHELDKGIKSTSAKKISSPDDFHSFVLNRIKATQEIVNNTKSLSEEERKGYQKTIDKINSFVTTPKTGLNSFLYKAILNYDASNFTLTPSIDNWREFEHLPFQDATGDDNRVVFTKATGFTLGVTSFVRPKNTEELLESFINFGRSRAMADDFLNDEDPYQRYMADTPQHAFTLTPEDPSIVDAMKDKGPAKKWIEKSLIEPGRAVSKLVLSNDQKNALIAYVKQELIPEELKDNFDKALKKLHDKNATVHSYAKRLSSIIYNLNPKKDEDALNHILGSLTKAYFDSVLPPAAKKILTDSSAKIADTNWVDSGVKHIYFTCFFDPVTNSLQLGTINEDGSGLYPLNQNEWVTYVPWEMYGVKLTPTLADHEISVLKT